MKHYILIYPDKPYEEKLDERQVEVLRMNFVERLKGTDLPSEGVLKFPGGLLLINREIAESVLSQIYYVADKSALNLRLRFFSEEC